MACITNIEKHRKRIAEDLATFPLPSLEEAYSLIRHEA